MLRRPAGWGMQPLLPCRWSFGQENGNWGSEGERASSVIQKIRDEDLKDLTLLLAENGWRKSCSITMSVFCIKTCFKWPMGWGGLLVGALRSFRGGFWQRTPAERLTNQMQQCIEQPWVISCWEEGLGGDVPPLNAAHSMAGFLVYYKDCRGGPIPITSCPFFFSEGTSSW